MAQLNTVKAARKANRCERGHDIPVGAGYYWWANKRTYGSTKHVRCLECRPRGSEMISSPYRRSAYAAIESVEDALAGGDLFALAAALESAADDVEADVADALEESAQNIEDGFGHETYQSAELRERADAARAWADTLRTAASEVEGFADEYSMAEQEFEDAKERATSEDIDEEDLTYAENEVAAAESEMERTLDEARAVAEDAIGECPE